MLKTKLMLMRANSYAKKNKATRFTPKYQGAKHIGILFSIEDQLKENIIRKFIQRLENEGKQISVLSYLPKKKENYSSPFPFFTKKDLSFWGRFLSQEVLSFTEKNFDYLLCPDQEPETVVKGILAMSQAKCRIGKFQENHDRFFEMMITTQNNNDLKESIDEMYHYIKKLG